MSNNCIYLKQKLNKKLECKKQKKIINIRDCNNCKYKEYKCTEFSKNSANRYQKKTTLHNKNAKLAKLERNRFSVFTDDLDHCIICKRKKDHLHEIFFGSNRQKSMRYGFVIPLCTEHHVEMHRNKDWQEFWHVKGQEYWKRKIGDREEFIEEFRKNYFDK